MNPEESFSWNFRGISKFNLDQYEEAIKDLDQAIKLNPENYYTFRRRGLCHRELGKKGFAKRDFQKAIKLGDKESIELIKSLNA